MMTCFYTSGEIKAAFSADLVHRPTQSMKFEGVCGIAVVGLVVIVNIVACAQHC